MQNSSDPLCLLFDTIGVVFYDIETKPQPSLFFLRIPLAKLKP